METLNQTETYGNSMADLNKCVEQKKYFFDETFFSQLKFVGLEQSVIPVTLLDFEKLWNFEKKSSSFKYILPCINNSF